jgi:hypothetical protein
MEWILFISRWLVAVAAGGGWLVLFAAALVHVVIRSADDLFNSPIYHVSFLAGAIAVVAAPIGSIGNRAPYALLAIVPEVLLPLKTVLWLLRRKYGD